MPSSYILYNGHQRMLECSCHSAKLTTLLTTSMASYNSGGHNSDSNNSSIPAERTGQGGINTSRRESEQVLPPAVEAVVQFGYSRDLVLTTYRQLQASRGFRPASSEGQGESVSTGSQSRQDGMTSTGSETSSSSSLPHAPVTAAALLMAVDDALRHNPSMVAAAPSQEVVEVPLEDGDGAHPSHTSGHNQPSTENDTPSTSSASNAVTNPSLHSAASSMEELQDTATPTNSEETSRPSTNSENAPETVVVAEAPTAARDRSPHQISVEESAAPAASADQERERACRRRQQLMRLRALREENRRLKARGMCRHCKERPVGLTLLPCGHFCLCEECGPAFNTCPLCRKTVLADVKTFLS